MGTDLITLEVLRNKFDVIADEMEIALLKSAYSSIVKEGMDASAALFTTRGETIAQAASIPIHLGSLVPAVQRIIQEFPVETMQEGDVYIMNDPYDGGLAPAGYRHRRAHHLPGHHRGLEHDHDA